MKNVTCRSGVDKLRKERLVDIIMSLAFTARAIPGVQDHLQAAYTIALKSPACGGGMDAALRHLNGLGCHPASKAAMSSSEGDDDVDPVPSNQSPGNDDATSSCALKSNKSDALDNEDPSARKDRPICRSLWKGRDCEDPTSCDRAHKPLCKKDACKTARDPTCHDWHYIAKKERAHTGRDTGKAKSRHSENSNRGRSAPRFKPANSKPKHMSQATENMYLKWRLSEMQLEQSRAAATTYKDVLVSSNTKPQGPPAAHSGLAPQPVVLDTLAPCSNPQVASLGPILQQLENITTALKAAGIMRNAH